MLWLDLRLGPVKIVALTQPPVVDCSGKLEAAPCAEVFRQIVEFNVQEYGYSGPATYFKLEPIEPGATCGSQTIQLFRFTFGPFGVTSTRSVNPIC
jgi:hypothetical protein